MPVENKERAEKRLPLTPTTKQRLDERKENGETYDHLIRREIFGDFDE